MTFGHLPHSITITQPAAEDNDKELRRVWWAQLLIVLNVARFG